MANAHKAAQYLPGGSSDSESSSELEFVAARRAASGL
jgi:hypothetical protein